MSNWTVPRPWKIYLLDFHDGRAQDDELFDSLSEIAELFNSTDYVYYASRNHVVRRRMSVEGKRKSREGKFRGYGVKVDFNKDPFPPFQLFTSWNVGVLRYGVRSDLVEQIEAVQQNRSSKEEGRGFDSITSPRPRDVAHFWRADTIGDNDQTGKLRSAVSRGLLEFAAEPDNSNWTVLADEIGKRKWSGRNQAQLDYAQALTTTKIVVVCQRDRWEERKKQASMRFF
jgi:hypothetical protein